MRFALLGDHPDAIEFVRSVTETGRHELSVYFGPKSAADYLARFGANPKIVADLEAALADSTIEAVIVGGPLAVRANQLRRALQSEHAVVCVHPAADSVNVAYEAAFMQQDGLKTPFPLLPEAVHPGVLRFAKLVRTARGGSEPATMAIAAAKTISSRIEKESTRARGLIQIERWFTDEIFPAGDSESQQPTLPGWDVMRLLGGSIAEVGALSEALDILPGEPLILSGRFVEGGLFQATYLPNQAEKYWRLNLAGPSRMELIFPDGWPGRCQLTYIGGDGNLCEENWPDADPWQALVAEWERTLATPLPRRGEPRLTPSLTNAVPVLSWWDEIRYLELDNATLRAVERRRMFGLDNLESSEDANFKSTMTLVGCSMLWLSLILLILSAWQPWLGWLIVPIFGVFLLMQLFRWAVPGSNVPANEESNEVSI